MNSLIRTPLNRSHNHILLYIYTIESELTFVCLTQRYSPTKNITKVPIATVISRITCFRNKYHTASGTTQITMKSPNGYLPRQGHATSDVVPAASGTCDVRRGTWNVTHLESESKICTWNVTNFTCQLPKSSTTHNSNTKNTILPCKKTHPWRGQPSWCAYVFIKLSRVRT